MKSVTLPAGETIAALGQGTWRMGERRERRDAEIAALRRGVECGMTLLDTAEMYGSGATESLVGAALAGIRDKVFLVSKATPDNASRTRLPAACAASLRRLGTDRLDLYLLHWRGRVPLAETVEAMERLVDAGQIRSWGVSNFDTDDMDDLVAAGGTACATNQILYNVTRRGAEFDLLPWLAARAIPPMAYSPVEQGRLLAHPELVAIAAARGASVAAVALAWVLGRGDTMVIPKAGSVAHVDENAAAGDLDLSEAEVARLDLAFPPPRRRTPLETL